MIQSFKNYLAALDHAGFVLEESEYGEIVNLIETPTRFVVTLFSLDGIYTVGIFIKATISGAGDFTGVPAYEGEDQSKAFLAMMFEANKG